MRLRTPFSIKRYLPKTLLGRSLLILILPVLLIQIFTTYIFFDRHWSKMTSRLGFAVAGEISNAVEQVKTNTDYDIAELDRLKKRYERHLNIKISYNKADLPKARPSTALPYLWEAIVARKFSKELNDALKDEFDIYMDVKNKDVEVRVALNTGYLLFSFPERRLFSSSGYIFLLWMIGMSFLLLMIAILFMRNQIRPIRKLSVVAERFGKGRDVQSFKPSGAHEVRQASQAFIDMRRRIKRQIEQRTIFLAGVSHDLKTPLTRMKLQLAMMDENEDIKDMRGDIEDMENMIKGYIDFVSGDDQEASVPFDIQDFMQECVTASLAQHKISEIILPQNSSIVIKPMLIKRCFVNILNNSARYSDKIWISAYTDSEYGYFQFDDDGPGIPVEKYDDVFKPFYRLEQSRNRDTGGTGLGLPIAMDAVHAHGGQIDLSQSGYGGLRVSIKLPI